MSQSKLEANRCNRRQAREQPLASAGKSKGAKLQFTSDWLMKQKVSSD